MQRNAATAVRNLSESDENQVLLLTSLYLFLLYD